VKSPPQEDTLICYCHRSIERARKGMSAACVLDRVYALRNLESSKASQVARDQK
jgi:hypothetical protein